MTGSINPIYINTTIQVLEKRCFILLSEVYADIKSKKTISINWVEEDISKELTNCLQSNKKRIAWKIRVEPEHRLYKEDNLSANKSPRIDFCFSTWTDTEWEFFAEAKNLIESDCETNRIGKNGKISINAHSLYKRYIETGIDNFISGKYPPNGCLIGYILQGKAENIISALNSCLYNLNRESERLNQHSFGLIDFESSYISTHNSPSLMKHLMFDFTSNIV